MDFGGFYLFGLLALVVFAYGIRAVILYARRSPLRRRNLTIVLGGIVSLAVLGRVLYQAYWLDEALFFAAARGKTAEVKRLLYAGANVDSRWEDGTTALNVAKANGHEEIATILRNAGAKE
jgi:hypothetical protein